MDLNEFCTAHYETARGFAVHFLRGQFDHVDDVVQTAFFKVCRSWKPARQGTWEEKSQVMWLHTIVYHACIDQTRRRQPDAPLEEEWATATTDHLEHDVAQRQLIAQTWQQLREVDKEALRMAIQGYRPRDTAFPEAFKKRAYVARRAFKQFWQQANVA